MNPIREKKVENEVKIEEKGQEKEKEKVFSNPFGSLSLFSKYIFGVSDLHTKLKTLPTIKIMGTMDLRGPTLEEEGSENRNSFLYLSTIDLLQHFFNDDIF